MASDATIDAFAARQPKLNVTLDTTVVPKLQTSLGDADAEMSRPIGASDAAVDAVDARNASAGTEPNRIMPRADPLNSGATVAEALGPLGASDAAYDAFAARPHLGSRIRGVMARGRR